MVKEVLPRITVAPKGSFFVCDALIEPSPPAIMMGLW